MPASNTDLNSKASIHQNGRKRKREDIEEKDSERATFDAVAFSTSTAAQSHTFAPVVTVPRACLPLAWLNPIATAALFPPGQLFAAQIREVEEWEQNVLVARLIPNGGLYGVEKVAENTYIACALQSWVTEDWCNSAANGQINIPDLGLLLPNRPGHSRTGSSSSNIGRLSTPCIPKKPENRRGALARMSILTSSVLSGIDDIPDYPSSPKAMEPNSHESDLQTSDPGALSVAPATLIQQKDPLDLPLHSPVSNAAPQLADGLEVPITEASTEQQIKQDSLTLEMIRQHYFETLYLSKTSLAFYAKGPLNRARAQLRVPEIDVSTENLDEYYRRCILPVKKMDTKYKESLLRTIQELSPADMEEAAHSSKASKASRKASKKKVKLGKDCLWSGEDNFIRQWWYGRELKPSSISSGDAHADEMRKAISELRTRETEMQLLLILEVLLLEKMPAKPAAALPNSDIKTEPTEEDAIAVLAKTPQSKKKRDLSSDLDTIVDRLCIWHTVSLDDLLASPEKAKEGDTASISQSKDRLRDFCANIIVPFYASKLPNQCKSICRKLGGPEISPQRPKVQAAKASATPLPGTAVKSRTRPAIKRTLERVLSEDQSMRHASPPVLSRSATAPLVPHTKRESSDFSMSQRPMSRGGMHKSVSFSNREIDLVADAKAQAAKRKKLDKLATQKRELEAAIDALKKPNRTNAAKAIMDEVEHRAIGSGTGSKQSVQITATPKKGRVWRSYGREEPELPFVPMKQEEPIIPSSTIKPKSHLNADSSNRHSRSSATKRAVLSAIHETPSRGILGRTSNPLQLPLPPPSSQVAVAATPSTSRLRTDLPSSGHASSTTGLATPLRMTKSHKPVLFTPLRKTEVRMEDAFRDAPMIPADAGQAMDRVMGGKGVGDELELSLGCRKERPETTGNRSLYDELGWNDDYDL